MTTYNPDYEGSIIWGLIKGNPFWFILALIVLILTFYMRWSHV
jgi:hypothetical protein